MAYRKNYLDEEQEQGQPLGSGGIVSGNAGQGGAAPTKSANTGSGWTNLSQYLGANAGQTEGLANTYVGGGQKVVDNAKAVGSDLVNNTKKDQKWSEPINQAKGIANEIRTGDVTKVDAGKFGSVAGSSYVKPEYGSIEGYGDVLKSFSDAGQKVQKADDYNHQKTSLQSEFGGSGNYGQGSSTLDTFLMRADPTSKGRIAEFKTANDNFKDADARVKADVQDPLATFFDSQATSFDSAKADMRKAVTDRVGSYQADINSRKGVDNSADLYASAQAQYEKALKETNGILDPTQMDFSQYLQSNADFSAEDAITDDEWAALAALEGLGGDIGYDRTKANAANRYTMDEAGMNAAVQSQVDAQWTALLEQAYAGNAAAAEKLKGAMNTGTLTQGILNRLSPNIEAGGPSKISMENLHERVMNPGDIEAGAENLKDGIQSVGGKTSNEGKKLLKKAGLG